MGGAAGGAGGAFPGIGGPLTPGRAAMLSAGASMMGAKDPWRGAGRGIQTGLGTYLSMKQAQLEEQMGAEERKQREETLELQKRRAKMQEDQLQLRLEEFNEKARKAKEKPPETLSVTVGAETVRVRWDPTTEAFVPIKLATGERPRGLRYGRTEFDPGVPTKTRVTQLQKQGAEIEGMLDSIQRIANDPELEQAVGISGWVRENVGGLMQQIPGLTGAAEMLEPEETAQIRTRMKEFTNKIVRAMEESSRFSEGDVARAKELNSGLQLTTSYQQYIASLNELAAIVEARRGRVAEELGTPAPAATPRPLGGTVQDPSSLIQKYGLE